jgi:hypothetical protein
MKETATTKRTGSKQVAAKKTAAQADKPKGDAWG